MTNLALYADGELWGLACRAKALRVNGAAQLQGEVSLDGETFSRLLAGLGLPQQTAEALCRVLALPEARAAFFYGGGRMGFAANCPGLCFAAARGPQTAVVLALETERLAGAENLLLKGAYQAARFFCVEQLYFQYGRGQLPPNCTAAAELELPAELPDRAKQSEMLLYGRMRLTGSQSPFAQGMRELLGLEELGFAALKTGETASAGVYVNELTAGSVHVKGLFCTVGSGGVSVSGELNIGSFGFVLAGTMGPGEFSIAGAMPEGKVIDLGGGWKVTELALAIGCGKGLSISMLGRITARELMLFVALSFCTAPGPAALKLLSAATSELSLPKLVNSFANKTVSGVDAFDFIRIEGFTLPGAPMLSQGELNGGPSALLAGMDRALVPAKLAPKGAAKVSRFGEGWMVTDTSRMRHYMVEKNGRVLLNPQFYYAREDQPPMGGYEIRRGSFFCGVIRLLGVSVKLFFQTSDDGILAYLNISPIRTAIFSLTQSSKKTAHKVEMPAPGSMVTQYLDPDTTGPELFLCICAAEKCFYLDARLTLWSILNFDAHVVFADKKVSVDTRFNFLSLFEVSFFLRADYSSFNALDFEFSLIADTSGLRKLVERAIGKLEQAARDYDKRMESAVQKVNEARNSVNGLWSQIRSLDDRIQGCKDKIRNTSRWKRWIVAIGVGIQIGAYEIAKAGVYVALGVAQAALALAEGIIRAAQAIGDVALGAIKGFLQGVISLFYIERLALAGKVNAAARSAALGVKLDFVALGKKYSLESTLELGSGAGGRCSELLNGMVENGTAADVKQMGEAGRSSKQRYRAASLEGRLELFAQGADYCSRAGRYMRDLQAACAREYGAVLPESEAVLLEVDEAILNAGQNAELVLQVTDNMNFGPALRAIGDKLDQQPESRARRGRERKVEELNAQWEQLRALKNQVRAQSRSTCAQAAGGVFAAAQQKAEQVQSAGGALPAERLYRADPDHILDRAESLMYEKFGSAEDGGAFCPYCEPVILSALDERRENPERGRQMREERRTRNRRTAYSTRL